ncbi:MAG: tetratricopeptide repeat protein [Kiritimatiellae bacterium]|nr:tetratricopeptide repeat protein [Kiritimatiellia bacterium]MDD5521668.1 tetratricopeptide repeat protein [Kiritimatiellia bacterium]
MKRLILIACFVFLAGSGFSADNGDDRLPAAIQFKKAQQILTMADEARDREKYINAITLYREALITYIKLSKNYPDWQPGVTQFRIVYCNNQLDALLDNTDKKDLAEIATSDRTDIMVPADTPAVTGNNTTLNKKKIENIKSEAKILLGKGNTEKARAILLNGLRMEPDDINMRMLMGITHCRANEFENAMYLTEPLIQEDPSNAIAHIILGTAYFGLGKIPDAAKQMQEALTLNPKLAEAHYNLAQILLASKPAETNAARNHYKSALELGSQPDTNLNFLLLEPPQDNKH